MGDDEWCPGPALANALLEDGGKNLKRKAFGQSDSSFAMSDCIYVVLLQVVQLADSTHMPFNFSIQGYHCLFMATYGLANVLDVHVPAHGMHDEIR